jgi:hypothetical protein
VATKAGGTLNLGLELDESSIGVLGGLGGGGGPGLASGCCRNGGLGGSECAYFPASGLGGGALNFGGGGPRGGEGSRGGEGALWLCTCDLRA